MDCLNFRFTILELFRILFQNFRLQPNLQQSKQPQWRIQDFRALSRKFILLHKQVKPHMSIDILEPVMKRITPNSIFIMCTFDFLCLTWEKANIKTNELSIWVQVALHRWQYPCVLHYTISIFYNNLY